jgi:hypothetical protein
MRPHIARKLAAAAFALGISSGLRAQSSVVRVIGNDSVPIPFATVVVQGGTPSITDAQGRLSMVGRHQSLNAEIRRIGYSPWFGKIELPDTAATITIMMAPVGQQLGSITITGEKIKTQLQMVGFYDRWQDRQKGVLSATFIGPEELEKRHPSRLTDMLYGLSGVTMVRTPSGGMVAKGTGGTCFMTVMLDGAKLCPPLGCHVFASTAQNATQIVPPPRSPGEPTNATLDDTGVDLNRYIQANDVSAIEVYTHGGNMPASLQVTDNACGVIAIWTGSRR